MSANKSFSNETSERYSRALFEVLREDGELDKSERDIKNFQSIYRSSLEIKNFFKDPTQSISQQIKIVNLLADKLELSTNVKNFFFLLVEKRRIFFINKIAESFLKLCSNKRGELKASLVSSKELSQSLLDKISNDISTAVGSNIKFDYKVDKDLIGGMKVQLGSIMIDTSIKNKLKQYKKVMLEI